MFLLFLSLLLAFIASCDSVLRQHLLHFRYPSTVPGGAKKKLTCLIKHSAETKEFITRKTCSSLSLMSNLNFDMPYMLFHAVFAEISKFQFQHAFCKSAQIC